MKDFILSRFSEIDRQILNIYYLFCIIGEKLYWHLNESEDGLATVFDLIMYI